MNRLLLFLLTLISGSLALFLQWPWYTIGCSALLLALVLPMRRRAGFWYAFWAGLFTWGGFVTYIHLSNDGRLAGRMAGLFQLGSGWWMVLITACWGAITAGLGGWTGVSLRKVLPSNQRSRLPEEP